MIPSSSQHISIPTAPTESAEKSTDAHDALITAPRQNTLARAATLFKPEKQLAPPPTAIQSVKAIVLASCSCHFFHLIIPLKCAATRVKYSPIVYTRFSLCIQPNRYVRAPDLFVGTVGSAFRSA